jgi:hypothetical protein
MVHPFPPPACSASRTSSPGAPSSVIRPLTSLKARSIRTLKSLRPKLTLRRSPGHAWWHLGTGVAPYFCITGATFLMLSLKEPNETFVFDRSAWGLPIIVRQQSAADDKPAGSANAQEVANVERAEKPTFAAVTAAAAAREGEIRRRLSVSPVLDAAPERRGGL